MVWACCKFHSGSQVFSADEYPFQERDKNNGQGIPSVRGFRQLHIPLLPLSPQGEGLHNLACVQLFPNRWIREKRGRCHGSSMLAVVGGDRQVEK